MKKKESLALSKIEKNDDKVVKQNAMMKDIEKSYSNPTSNHMPILWDVLIALRALKQYFAKYIKCIYSGPPYNTSSAFECYKYPDLICWINTLFNQLGLFSKSGQQFNPGFLVEITTDKFIIKVKTLTGVTSDEVLSKARKGMKWCCFTSTAAADYNLREYKLISDDNFHLGNTCKYSLNMAHAVKEET